MKRILLLLFSALVITLHSQTIVVDYDGNVYPTVTIGTQMWLKENLRSVHYTDGSLIGNACWYNNNLSTDTTYGKLYQWDAAMKNSQTEMTQGVCPTDWHLPKDAEWIQLFNTVSDSNNCAFALKDTNTTFWTQPLIASNSTGFSIVGGGNGYVCSTFDLMGTHAEFWTSTEISSTEAKNWSANNQSGAMFRHYNQDKPNGFSVRCVRNTPAGIRDPEEEFNENFIVYINKSENSILISSQNNTGNIVGYCILAVDGKILSSGNFISKKEIILPDVASGIYILSLLNNHERLFKKLIISR